MKWQKLLLFLRFILGFFLIRNLFLTTEAMTFIGEQLIPSIRLLTSTLMGNLPIYQLQVNAWTYVPWMTIVYHFSTILQRNSAKLTQFCFLPTLHGLTDQALNTTRLNINSLKCNFHPSILQQKLQTLQFRVVANKCKNEDYIYHPRIRFCYKIEVKNRRDWGAAREVCQQDGGDLIVFDTIDKFQHINATLKANTILCPLTGKRCISIGAHKVGAAWFWVDGTPFKYLTNPLWTFTKVLDTQTATVICSNVNFHISFKTPTRASKFICEMNPTS